MTTKQKTRINIIWIALIVTSLTLATMLFLSITYVYAATVEIPTYTFDNYTGYGFTYNGTTTFGYNTTTPMTDAFGNTVNTTQVPYKNGTITLDLIGYDKCVKESNATIIADANLQGTNVPANQEDLKDSMINGMDTCIIRGTISSESLKSSQMLQSLNNTLQSMFGGNDT
jgi:hypothetical protein